LIGLLLGVVLRNIIGAIAFVFIVPGTVESLLALLLKDNAMYLPFTALERFVGSGVLPQGAELGIAKATAITLAYFAAGWALTAYFFVRRDSN
jgi:hypothetical protein